MKYLPKRRFGQNFLIDQEVIRCLINAIQPQPDDSIVEIGPGLGALTQPLLSKLDHLQVVELDRDIVSWMRDHYPADKMTIHSADALKFDFSSLGEKTRIVGNLPYNISTPLLFHLVRYITHIEDMHFMLQKEVVERMVAEPSTSQYGRLSVMLQYRFQMSYLFTVPAQAFDPIPKVDSAFVRLHPYKQLPFPAENEIMLEKIVAAAFSQRRKTLRNALKGLLDDDDFSEVGIKSQLRAENLTLAQFVAIANFKTTQK